VSVSDLVGDIEGVRRRTRRATRGGAVPLALLGLLVGGAAPAYAIASVHNVSYGGGSGELVFPSVHRPSFLDRLLLAHPNVTGSNAIGIYWLLAAPVAFAAVAAYYAWRARRTGLSVDGWRVAAFGGGLFAALVLVMAYAGGPLTGGYDMPGIHAIDVVNPFLVVALSVFALAWVERSVVVLLAGLVFAGCVATADWWTYSSQRNVGWENWTSWGWMTVILGGVLLVWAGIVGLVRRPRA
jgi:hypothetical protein